MGIRISEMEEATTFGADDYVPIVTNGTNKKALGQKIKDFIAGFFATKTGDNISDKATFRSAIEISATNTPFDKTGTGMSAENVQAGIVELSGNRALIDGSNIANPSAFRQNIGLGGETGINGYFDWATGSGVSVPNATRTDIYQKTITVTGVYMVQFIGNWDRKAGGSRVILVAPNSKPQVNGGRRTSNTSFVGTEASLDWFQEHVFFQTLNAGDTLYFCAYQNSGSAITMYPIINIIRIQ